MTKANQTTLLLYKGEFVEVILKRENHFRGNLVARRKGFQNLKQIDAIVPETKGYITVLPKMESTDVEVMK